MIFHSTETTLLHSANQCLINMDKGLINGFLFLDLKKAFDTVDHKNVFSAGMYEIMIIVRGSSTLPLRGNLIVKDSINRAGKHQSSSLTNSPTVRTRNMAEAEDNSIGASVSESNSTVQEVFSMFKSYLEDKIEEKSKQIESKGNAEKDVIKLKFKGNQKQYEINAKLEAILTDISKANEQNNQERVSKLVDEAKALIHRLQKLIKIADRSKDGWRVVEEYESDDLASNSEDEKRLRKAIESAGRKRKIETNKVQQK